MSRIGKQVLALAVVVALPALLPAQGAKVTGAGGRAMAVAADAAAPASSAAHAQPARGILATLVGTWRFEIRFAGNYGGPPDATGMRTIRPLFDDLRVEWTEAFDQSPMQGRGIVGFDASSDRFFWSAVYSAGSSPELLTGVLDDAQPTIAFRPVGGRDESAPASLLVVVDDDHLTWVAADHSWRAVFTRQR